MGMPAAILDKLVLWCDGKAQINNYMIEYKYMIIKTNVLKTGPDRPVQPVQPSTGSGHNSGPVCPIEPLKV